jgi:hypothetical protein
LASLAGSSAARTREQERNHAPQRALKRPGRSSADAKRVAHLLSAVLEVIAADRVTRKQ